jgi:hypothetical protein
MERAVMANNGMNMMGMMKEHMKGCRVCAIMPIIFGTILFLLGYFLDAEIVRIIWLIFSGFIVLMGTSMLLMITAMNK